MAPNSHLLVKNFLNFGQFDVFKPRPASKRKRMALNCLIRLVTFFSAFKIVTIVLAAWFGFLRLKLYLIELYLFDENHQKVFDVGYSFLHIGLYVGFTYWTSLHEKASSLKSFSFLIISGTKNAHQFGRRHHLDQESTSKFLDVYRKARLILRLLVSAYSVFAAATILRCLYYSFNSVNFVYFLCFSILLSGITLMEYVFMTVFLISKFLLVVLSIEFLIFRVRAIDALLCNQFIKTKITSTKRPIHLRKQTPSTFKTLQILNDFCCQFKEINSVLDSSLSVALIGVFTIFVIP